MMAFIELLLVTVFILAIGAFGIYHARKTRHLQKAYNELSEKEKKQIDSNAHLDTNIFAYSKPMNKWMWGATIIGIAIFIFVLLGVANGL